MKKSSRALSFILCLIMIMGMLPTQAFATELDPAIVGEPSPEPILEATQEPILEPGLEPTSEPPVEPATEPAPEEPTLEPTTEPTTEPTAESTVAPTEQPTLVPEYVSVSFNCTPAELSLNVYVTYEETVAAQTDGSYLLAPGYYAYSAACEGYIGVELVPFEVVSGSGSISIDVTLEAIPPEPELPAPVRVEFNCTPAETLVWVADEFDNEYEPEADGSFLLMPGSYYYVAFCEGYVGIDGELIVEAGSAPISIDVVMEADAEPEVAVNYSSTGWLWPVESSKIISSNFGMRDIDGNGSFEDFHSGIDISCVRESKVRAAKSGHIIDHVNIYAWNEKLYYGDMRSYGNYVAMRHDDGTYAIYAHLSPNGMLTSGYVTQGTIIALSGDSGWSGGPHLHFQVSKSNNGWSAPQNVINTMPTQDTISRLGLTVYNPYVAASGYDTARMEYIFSTLPQPPATPTFTNLQCNYPTDSSGRATVTFTWNEASGADRYFLEICNLREDGTYRSYFESGLGYEGTQSSALSLSEGWYYVRLIANNGAGSTNGNKQFFSVGHGSTSPVSSTKYNGHTYERYDCHMSWTEAKAFCESLGGYLAVPSSQAEQTAINSLMTGTTNGLYFLGLSDIKQDGTWETVTGEPVSYTNWSSGEPSYSANEYYVHMYARYEDETIVSEGKWNDVANKNSDIGSFWNYGNIGFICEYDNKHEHSWSGTVTKNATCTADGVKTFSCSGCSETYTEKLPALGHDYKTTTISGSCTQRPGTKYTCSRCSDTYTDWDEGGWSEWSTTYPSGVDSEYIETATQYRYRNKETTTSNSQTLTGWTYSGSEQVWSDYGSWSNWSTNSVTASDSTQVEKAPLYRYYYFLCDTCGDHNPFSGGCGCGGTSNYWVETRSTIAYSQSNSSVVSYASSKRQTWSIGDGQQWYFSSGNLNATAIGTIDADGTAEVISQGYRYRTRSQSTVYNFYRWSEWSAWSGTAASASASKEVEKRTVYRYDLYVSGKHSWNNGSVTQNPNCTVEGVKTYTCTSCGDTKTEAIAAKGHTEVVDKAVAATCTAAGKTEGKHCSVCSAIIKAQTTVPAKGHTEVVDKAVAATCTTAGKTEGKHCSVCNVIIKAQTTVPAKGHTEVADKAVAATCTTAGKTEGKHCSVCNVIIKAQTTVPAKGHTEVVDKAVAATCTAAGKTEGKHCSVCSAIIKAQTTVPAKGHDFGEWTQTKAPTLTEDGEESRSCRNNGCSEVESRVIKATVYTVSYDANGGSGAPVDQKKLKGTAITLSSITPSRDGHTFIGWALSSTATTIDYAPGASYTDDTDATLYAIWEEEQDLTSGICGDNLIWAFDETTGQLTISGTGTMYDYTWSEAPWYNYRSLIKTVSLPNDLTSIGNGAFKNCQTLTNVTIPNSVTSIGRSAFYSCRALTNVVIPDKVASINSYAFAYCRNLRSVTIPESVTSIGERAFYECYSLADIAIPQNVTSIGSSAFYCCKMSNVTIPVGVLKIEPSTFSQCTSLKSVTIPNTVTSIGAEAFNDCRELTSIIIPKSVTNIDSYAFRYCSKLTDITFEHESSDSLNITSAFYVSNATDTTVAVPDKTSIHSAISGYDWASNNRTVTVVDIIPEKPEGESCGDGVTWSYDEATGTLTISGNGAMYDYIDSPVPWADYYTTNIVIEPGVTALGINAISYLNGTMTIKSGCSLDIYNPIVLPDGSKLILEDGSSLNLKSKTYDVIIGDNGQSINMNWSGGLQFMGGTMETRGSASLSWEEYSLPFGYYPDKYITFSDATNYDIPTDRISYVYEVTTAQQLYAALETNHSHASINIAGAITVDRNITVPYNYNLSVNGFLGESVLTVPSPYVLTNNGFLHTNGNGKFVLGKEIETGETGMVPPNTVIEYSYVAKVGETGYMTLNEALVAAASGGTVQLQKDAEDTYIMVTPGITLDLNGYTLTASYLVGFNGTNVVDSSAENSGLLKVPSANNVVLAAGNSQLPVWTGEGYMFVEIIGFTEWNLTTADGRPQYLFEPAFETIAHQYVSKGAESSKVKVAVTLSWDEATATAYQDYVYTDTTVYNVINSYNGSYYNRVFGVIINNTEHGTERSAVLISDTGVKMHFPKN